MIDLGWTELFFLAVILIIVVGPKDLPGVLRGFGQMMRKVRSLADEFRRGMDEFIRESELQELSDGVDKARRFNIDQVPGGKTRRQSITDPTGPGAATDSAAANDPAATQDAAGDAAGETPATDSAPSRPPADTDTDPADKSDDKKDQ